MLLHQRPAAGGQITDANEVKQWVLHVADDFDDADLTGLDASAYATVKHNLPHPITNEKLNMWTVSSDAAGFLAAAQAHAKVYWADKDVLMDDITEQISATTLTPPAFSPDWMDNPSYLQIVGIPIADGVQWQHKALNTAAAFAYSQGVGAVVATLDTGFPSLFRWRGATACSIPFALDAALNPINDFDFPVNPTMANLESLTFTFDGGTPVVVTFDGSENTLELVATAIQTAITTAGEPGYAKVLGVDWAFFGADPSNPGQSPVEGQLSKWRYLAVGCSNGLAPTNAPSSVLVVTGDQTALDKLGMLARTYQNGEVPIGSSGDGAFYLDKYMTVEPHPAFNPATLIGYSPLQASALLNLFSEVNPATPTGMFTGHIPLPAALSAVWRKIGVTGPSANRTFTIDPVATSNPAPGLPVAYQSLGYSVIAMLNVGIRAGDKLSLKIGGVFKDFEVEEVLYIDPEHNNTAFQYKVKDPTSSYPNNLTNVEWKPKLKDHIFPYYDNSYHGTYTASLINGNPYKGIKGIAPGAALLPIKNGSGIAGRIAATEFASQIPLPGGRIGVDVMKQPSRGTGSKEAPFNQILAETLQYGWAHGMTTVSAIGNNGEEITNASMFELTALQSVVGATATAPFGYKWNGVEPPQHFKWFAPYNAFGKSVIDFAVPGGSFYDATRLTADAGKDSLWAAFPYTWHTTPRAKVAYNSDWMVSAGHSTFQPVGAQSAAAAIMTGLVALAYSVVWTGRQFGDPKLQQKIASIVKSVLLQSAQDQVGDPSKDKPGKDAYYGHGFIDAFEAVRKAMLTQG